MKQPPSVWTKHLKTPEEREKFLKTLRNSQFILSRLKALIEERLEEKQSLEVNDKTYEIPSWSHKQAHINGAKEELRKTIKLLEFLDA